MPRPRMRIVPYEECAEELLELRRLALVAAQQVTPGTPASAMYDPRDSEALIAIAELDGQLVGSLRIVPPLDDDVLFHPDNRVLGTLVGLPPKSDYAEASKACVHPEYQGQGVFWHIAAHMILAGRQLGKTHLVGGTNPRVWKFWQRCGYRLTENRYVGPNRPEIKYSVMVLDIDAVLGGRVEIAPQLVDALEFAQRPMG